MQNFPPPGQNYPPPGGAYAPVPPPAPPKKSNTPWIIAGVGCLALIVVAAIALVGIGYFASRKIQSTQATNVPAATQPTGTKQYVNSRAGRTGALAENYVDFSFYYPADWTLVPNPEINYVKVERKDEDGTTMENFSVGWVKATGTAFDKKLMPQLAAQASAQFARSLQDYQKVSEGETQIGAYEGYEIKFKGKLGHTAEGDVNVYGRAVLLPPPSGQTKSVGLIMLTTNLAPGIKGVDDVGVKGGLLTILDSFRLGTK